MADGGPVVVELRDEFNRFATVCPSRSAACAAMAALMRDYGFEGDAEVYLEEHDTWADEEGVEIWLCQTRIA